MIKFYQYKKCSTCQKAAKWLKTKNIEFQDIDITERPPSKKELQFMLKQYDGEIKKLFNTSGMVYREMQLSKKLPNLSDKEAIDLLSQNGKLIKRPFIIDQKTGRVGFKDQEWGQLF